MYGELQRIRDKTVVINCSVLHMLSSERNVKVAFGILGGRRRCELRTFENKAGVQSREIIFRQIKTTSCKISLKIQTILKNDCGLFFKL
jgi:hypothetical protein